MRARIVSLSPRTLAIVAGESLSPVYAALLSGSFLVSPKRAEAADAGSAGVVAAELSALQGAGRRRAGARRRRRRSPSLPARRRRCLRAPTSPASSSRSPGSRRRRGAWTLRGHRASNRRSPEWARRLSIPISSASAGATPDHEFPPDALTRRRAGRGIRARGRLLSVRSVFSRGVAPRPGLSEARRDGRLSTRTCTTSRSCPNPTRRLRCPRSKLSNQRKLGAREHQLMATTANARAARERKQKIFVAVGGGRSFSRSSPSSSRSCSAAATGLPRRWDTQTTVGGDHVHRRDDFNRQPRRRTALRTHVGLAARHQ